MVVAGTMPPSMMSLDVPGIGPAVTFLMVAVCESSQRRERDVMAISEPVPQQPWTASVGTTTPSTLP